MHWPILAIPAPKSLSYINGINVELPIIVMLKCLLNHIYERSQTCSRK
jgi:hypothetical protein